PHRDHPDPEERETMTDAQPAPTPAEPSRPGLDIERNRMLMVDYLENAWNRQDWDYAKRAVHPDVVFHDQIREGLPPGHEGMFQAMHRVFEAVPDFHVEITEMICERDLVTVVFHGSGTHTGTFMGYPATGRPVVFDSISIVRWSDEGQIIEGWQEADQMGMAQSIGMMPSGSMPKPMAYAMSFGTRLSDRLKKRR
ncbi:ester cyclase, partial [Kocuria palustris]|uniref:ester cyclase n=2 Tax=Micrococcaceae TaxID=1268 RepID=UPI00242E1881